MINTVNCWLCKQLAALSETESKGLTHRNQNTNKNYIYNLVADQIKNSTAKKVLSALKKTLAFWAIQGIFAGFLIVLIKH